MFCCTALHRTFRLFPPFLLSRFLKEVHNPIIAFERWGRDLREIRFL